MGGAGEVGWIGDKREEGLMESKTEEEIQSRGKDKCRRAGAPLHLEPAGGEEAG